MTKIGYLGMAAKPYHAGHHALIQIASTECDTVYLFISNSDRSRVGEHVIKNDAMQKIWTKYLLNIMPKNVKVCFTGSPIRSIYEKIGEINEGLDCETNNIIYGDNVDVERNFSDKSLCRYFPRLRSLGLVTVKSFSRTDTVNISGTAMRKFLELGLNEDFVSGLPLEIRSHGNEIWQLLGGSS